MGAISENGRRDRKNNIEKMNWRPNSEIHLARARQQMIQRIRDYFLHEGVTEVCTPALTSTAVTDPSISSLQVSNNDKYGFLQTSPEFAMKRLLAAGYPDIYQICQVFRGNESGRRHLLEFTMVEWYRLNFTLQNIIDDTIQLLKTLLGDQARQPPILISYSEAFENALGIDPLVISSQELANMLKADENLCDAMNADHDAWLDLAMATCVAPSFPVDQLTIVSHFPASQASLAQLCPIDNCLADRFEVFFGTTELANGFVELTDATEQRKRFKNEQEKRLRNGQSIPMIDDALIASLEEGLPPCAGVALGVDRALMVAEGIDDINQVVTFTPELHHDL